MLEWMSPIRAILLFLVGILSLWAASFVGIDNLSGVLYFAFGILCLLSILGTLVYVQWVLAREDLDLQEEITEQIDRVLDLRKKLQELRLSRSHRTSPILGMREQRKFPESCEMISCFYCDERIPKNSIVCSFCTNVNVGNIREAIRREERIGELMSC